MGEAKRRGSFEERKKQSIERKEREYKWKTAMDARARRHDGDAGRPVRPHRSGGGKRPVIAMALAAACAMASSGGFKS